MAGTISVPEITTAVITSAYIDLVVDLSIFRWQDSSCIGRFFFVSSMLMGSHTSDRT